MNAVGLVSVVVFVLWWAIQLATAWLAGKTVFKHGIDFVLPLESIS